MIIIDAFQIKGSKHKVLTTFRLDRKLTADERACKTALVGDDLELSLGSTTSDELMWTGDEIPNPKALIGQEIIFL